MEGGIDIRLNGEIQLVVSKYAVQSSNRSIVDTSMSKGHIAAAPINCALKDSNQHLCIRVNLATSSLMLKL